MYSRRSALIASIAGIGSSMLALPLRAQSSAGPSGRVPLEGYVIPPDLSVTPPPASFGPAAAAVSGWWKSINVPAIFELELLLVFEEFKSAHDIELTVAIKARRHKPGRTERVIAHLNGDTLTFVRNNDSNATLKVMADGTLQGKVVVSPKYPAIPATFQKVG